MEVKVSLTIGLPGAIMWSKEECLKTAQKVIEKKTKTGKVYKKTIEVQVDDLDKMDKHTMRVTGHKSSNPDVITFYTRKSKPATQSININKEAYNYMISSEYPAWTKPKVWSQYNSRQRLEAHLGKIAEHLGGKVLSYQIFED